MPGCLCRGGRIPACSEAVFYRWFVRFVISCSGITLTLLYCSVLVALLRVIAFDAALRVDMQRSDRNGYIFFTAKGDGNHLSGLPGPTGTQNRVRHAKKVEGRTRFCVPGGRPPTGKPTGTQNSVHPSTFFVWRTLFCVPVGPGYSDKRFPFPLGVKKMYLDHSLSRKHGR